MTIISTGVVLGDGLLAGNGWGPLYLAADPDSVAAWDQHLEDGERVWNVEGVYGEVESWTGDGAGSVNPSLQIGLKTSEGITLGAAATSFTPSAQQVILTGDAGTNTVTTIVGSFAGQTLDLIFVDSNVTLSNSDAHGTNSIDLKSTTNISSAQDKVVQLIYNGSYWYQAAEEIAC